MAKLGLRDHKYDEFSAATAMDLLKMEVEMSSTSPNKTISLLHKSPSFEVKSTTFLKKKTRRALVVLLTTMSIFVFLSWYYITQHGRMSIRKAGHVRFDPDKRELHLTNLDGENVLRAELGMFLPDGVYPLMCEEVTIGDAICIHWLKSADDNELLAEMVVTSEEEGTLVTIEIRWKSQKLDAPLQDCIFMDESHWYGGSSSSSLLWPLDKMEIEMQPYVSRENGESTGSFGGILERYWLSSAGLSLVVQDDVPLHVSSNENNSQKLCLRSEVLNTPFQNPIQDYPTLVYKVLISTNIREAHRHSAKTAFNPPTDTPNKELFSMPIWHTAILPNITNDSLQQFARSLTMNGFHEGNIEVEAELYMSNHLDSKNLITDHVTSNFTWTVHVSPYFDFRADSFSKLASRGFLIKDGSGQAPTLVDWRETYSGIVDATNGEAKDWLYEKWQQFRTANSFDAYVFQGGYGMPMPPSFEFYQFPDQYTDPTMFCKSYTEVADRLGRSGRRKCGHQSQDSPLFIQMDRWSPQWHHENGLQGIIPTVLLHGILGYPFVVPPPVCGAIDEGKDMHHPRLDVELYVRWVQLITYLPVMSFCVMPWDFNSNVTSYVRKMIEHHRSQVAPEMEKLALNALQNGDPIIRPIWWNAPTDENALTSDSEFLIGDKLLVAPVVSKGAKQRDIYLPQGRWFDQLREEVIEGRKKLRNYRVGLWEVPTFRRMD